MAAMVTLILNWDRLGPGNGVGWAFGFAVAAAALPPVCLYLWCRGHPPWLVVTVDGDSVKYQFLDAAYAAEFARLNDAEKDASAAARVEAAHKRLTGHFQEEEAGSRPRSPGEERAEREWSRALGVALDQVEKGLATGHPDEAPPNETR